MIPTHATKACKELDSDIESIKLTENSHYLNNQYVGGHFGK